MKRKILLKSLILLCTWIVGISNTMADNTVSWSVSGVQTTASGGNNVNTALTTTISPNTATGTWTAVATASYAGNNSGAQFGSSSYTFAGTISLSNTNIPSTATIKSISITLSSSGTAYKIDATVNNAVFGSQVSVNQKASKTYTFSETLGKIGNNIVLTFSNGGTKNVIITAISVTYYYNPYTITATVNDADMGSASVSGTTITASPNTGYRVKSGDYGYDVTLGTATVSHTGTSNTLTVTPSTNCTIRVNFEAIPTHTITCVADPVGGGTFDAVSSLYEGGTTSITALANSGYKFTGWSVDDDDNGAELSSTSINPTTLTMGTANVTVTATFESATTHAISYSVNGNVVKTVNVVEDEAIDLSAPTSGIPACFVFRGWVVEANKIDIPTDTDPSANFVTSATSTGDITYYAVMAVMTASLPDTYEKLSSNSFNSKATYLIGALQEGTGGDGSTIMYLYSYGNTVDEDISWGSCTSSPSTNTPVTFSLSGSASALVAKDISNNYLTCITVKNFAMSSTSSTVYLDTDGSIKTASDGNLLRYNHNNGSGGLRWYASTTGAQAYFYKVVKNNTYASYCTTAPEDVTIAGDMIVTTPIAIPSGYTLTVNGDLTNTTASNLIIEDGGQLILAKTNTGVAATVKKDVSAATAASKTDATYWYAISAGVENPLISSNTNLITESGGDPTYDLYRFNEAKNAGNAWENYRNSDYSATFTTLEKGRGYLYRNASDLTIAMTGDINVEDFTYNVTKTGSGEYAGFNLIGNPYTHDIYKGAGTAITSGTSTLSTGFYYLEPSTGKWAKGTDNSTAIAPNQGILVQVNTTGNINMTNTDDDGVAKSHNDYIMLSVANSQYSDEAYAWFDEGIGLNKIEHRNSEIPMLYINQNGENFAIATMSDETQSFNLNFKAMTTGKYTLSYKADGNFCYLHIIDRLTGEDVDMLLEGEYSFIASPIDSDNRFIVRLEYSAGSEISESSIFAYQSGNDIIVNGEGELQIFDMMGRRVLTQYVSGVETINLQLNGVFIFKLNEKTQKIVVR